MRNFFSDKKLALDRFIAYERLTKRSLDNINLIINYLCMLYETDAIKEARVKKKKNASSA